MEESEANLEESSSGPSADAKDAAPEVARILVVEDDPSIGAMIEEVLDGQTQYSVQLVTNPEAAIAAVKERPPDLALMDINLGSAIDGIETVKRFRELADVPVCFITAYSDEATVARAEQVDPMAYLVKPFETGDVMAMVKISLANARRAKAKLLEAARMEVAMRESQEAMLFLDGEGRLKSATEGVRQLLGWEPGAGVGEPWWEILGVSTKAEGRGSGEAEAILRPMVESARAAGDPAASWRGWYLKPGAEGGVPVSLSLKRESSLGELVCRLRSLPAAEERPGQNGGVNPVPRVPEAPVKPAAGLGKALAEIETEDALTGLPNQAAIRSRLPELEAEELDFFVLSVDHITVFRQRFGSGAIDRIVLSYSQHLAQHLPEQCQLARWDRAMFVILPRTEAGLEIEREIARVLSAPLLYHLQLSGRSALLRVTSTFTLCRVGTGGSLEKQIEGLAREQKK